MKSIIPPVISMLIGFWGGVLWQNSHAKINYETLKVGKRVPSNAMQIRREQIAT